MLMYRICGAEPMYSCDKGEAYTHCCRSRDVRLANIHDLNPSFRKTSTLVLTPREETHVPWVCP